MIIMTLWKKLLGVVGIAALLYSLVSRKADAWSFEGLNYGSSAANSIVWMLNPQKTDSVSATASFYVPRMKGWYWSKDTPPQWNVQMGDTCWFHAKDATGTKKQETWRNVTATGNLVIPICLDRDKNYTFAIRNITNSGDTLVEMTTRVKHNGNWSDPVVDTAKTATSYHDGHNNIARSDSVWNWTAGGNWNAILNDSVVVDVRGLVHGGLGSSRGTIRRQYIDGDVLPDIALIGVEEREKGLENKLGKYDLQVLGNPSKNPVFSCKGYVGKKTGLRVYGAAGEFLGEYASNNGMWQVEGLKAGVYFGVVEGSRKKFVVVEPR